MFAYCNNNPIKYVDYGGNRAAMNESGKNRVYINDGAKKPFLKMNGKNFKFQENPDYNLLNAMQYAEYIKIHYYGNDLTRTKNGIYVELQAHYIAYCFGNSHAVDGADMGEASFSKDKTAWLSEIIARCAEAYYESIFSPKFCSVAMR